MQEVKSPKKPLLYYYGVVLLVLLVFNLIVTPLLLKEEVTEVDYGTFMSMTEDKNIGQVQVEDQQIVFTDKDEKNVYKTNAMDDPQLTERLYESGAKFSKDVDASTSPLLSLLITGILPMLIFIGLGQYMVLNYRVSALSLTQKANCTFASARAAHIQPAGAPLDHKAQMIAQTHFSVHLV